MATSHHIPPHPTTSHHVPTMSPSHSSCHQGSLVPHPRFTSNTAPACPAAETGLCRAWCGTREPAASPGDKRSHAASGRILNSSIVRQEEMCLANVAVTALKHDNLILTTSLGRCRSDKHEGGTELVFAAALGWREPRPMSPSDPSIAHSNRKPPPTRDHSPVVKKFLTFAHPLPLDLKH